MNNITKKPTKQRKRLYSASLHKKHSFLNAHLSKELREKYNTRSIALRKGDKVKIMLGSFKGKEGKVTLVDTKKGFVTVENILIKKKDGKEIPVKLNPSNVLLVDLYLDDEKRFKNLRGPENGEQRK